MSSLVSHPARHRQPPPRAESSRPRSLREARGESPLSCSRRGQQTGKARGRIRAGLQLPPGPPGRVGRDTSLPTLTRSLRLRRCAERASCAITTDCQHHHQ
ncbi:unnamed protein product, partial [Ectocarpus sp. 8 AP-2014]